MGSTHFFFDLVETEEVEVSFDAPVGAAPLHPGSGVESLPVTDSPGEDKSGLTFLVDPITW